MMTFDSLTPSLRTAAPSLPFADAPAGAAQCSLPYAAAAIAWAGLSSTDDTLCDGNSILEIVLSPLAVARVINKLGELKFDFTRSRSVGQLVDDIEAFAQANPGPAFILKEADLEAISSKTAAVAPPA